MCRVRERSILKQVQLALERICESADFQHFALRVEIIGQDIDDDAGFIVSGHLIIFDIRCFTV